MKPGTPRDGKNSQPAIVYTRPITLASNDGVLAFALTRSPVGVHVKRTHRRSGGEWIECSAVFDDEESFVEWIGVDELRFTYPLVFQQLGKRFNEFICDEATP